MMVRMTLMNMEASETISGYLKAFHTIPGMEASVARVDHK